MSTTPEPGGDTPKLPEPTLPQPSAVPPPASEPPLTPLLPDAPAAVTGAPAPSAAAATSVRHATPGDAASASETETARAGALKLREQAKKRRRRNLIVSRVVLVVLLGGIGAGGYFGYQAYRDDQDRQEAERLEREASGETVDLPDNAGAGPLGNIQEGLQAQDDLNDIVSGPSGRLGADLADDARDLVDDLNGGDSSSVIVPPTAVGAPADLPGYRTVTYGFLLYRNSTEYTQYDVDYDAAADQYSVGITDSTDPAARRQVIVGNEWVTQINADGSMDRWRRSEASLDPAPDPGLFGLVSVDDVLALADGYVAEIAPDLDPATFGSDAVAVYLLDQPAFESEAGAQYAAWVARWSAAGLAGTDIVVESTHEVRAADERYVPPMPRRLAVDVAQVATGDPRILIGTIGDGVVNHVSVLVPPVQGFYVLDGYTTDAARLLTPPGDGWSPA